MITELLQQPGSFEISLRPDAPLALRKSIPYQVSDDPYGHIAVTPKRMPPQSLTKTSVLTNARWCGRIQSRSNRMHTYSGHGLAVWLGDADNKADYITALGGGAPDTMVNLVTTLLTSNGNGITLGTTTGASGTTVTTAFNNALPIDVLNELADSTSNAWKINPDGTLDISAPGTLFEDPPVVVLMDGQVGTDSIYTTIPCTNLDVQEDFDDYATIAVVTGQSSSAGLASITKPKDFGGSNGMDVMALINANASTNAECNTTGSTYLNLHSTSRRQVSGTIAYEDVADPRQYMTPGDKLYLFEPECELYDLTKQVLVLGGVAYPTTSLLRGITWPVVEGMGVYTIQTQDGSNTVVDLSDYVDFEDHNATTLELGAPKRPAAQPTARAFGSRTA